MATQRATSACDAGISAISFAAAAASPYCLLQIAVESVPGLVTVAHLQTDMYQHACHGHAMPIRMFRESE